MGILLLSGVVIISSWCFIEMQRKDGSYFHEFKSPPAKSLNGIDISKNRGVILIIIDALRPDHLGCYGYERDTSPAVDRLAGEGVLFTDVFANAPWTRPSTACIFTSLHASQHGVQTEKSRLSPKFLTLAEVLSESGVKTGAVIGNGNANSIWGFDQGFDDYIDTKKWNGLPDAKMVFDAGKSWIKENKDDKFFLTLFTIDPHSPYKSPENYEKLYTRQDRDKILRAPKWQYEENLDTETVYNMVGLYDGAIRYVDDVIKDFIAELKDLGIYESTTIIFTADHGEGFGEHNRYRHGYHFYEEFIRVPLIVRSPCIKESGVHSERLTALIDIYPTVLDLFGMDIPSVCQGISIFSKDEITAKRNIYSEYNNFGLRNQCVRGKEWKLIYEAKANKDIFFKYIKDRKRLPFFLLDKEKYELYNLAEDPFEKNNLYRDEPKVATDLLLGLIEYLKLDIYNAKELERDQIDPVVLKELKSLGYIR